MAADEAAAVSAFEEVFAEFERLDALMSVWREGSDVLRLNAAAARRPVKVSAEVLEVLRIVRQVSEWTEGKFDVTFGRAYGPLASSTTIKTTGFPTTKRCRGVYRSSTIER